MISMSKFSTTDDSEEAISKAGDFVESAMASAMRLVFPVLEKYNTQGFIIRYSKLSLYKSLIDLTRKRRTRSYRAALR